MMTQVQPLLDWAQGHWPWARVALCIIGGLRLGRCGRCEAVPTVLLGEMKKRSQADAGSPIAAETCPLFFNGIETIFFVAGG